LSRDPTDRFQTAREMALALESALVAATTRRVTTWVEALAGDAIAARAKRVAEIESSTPTHRGPSLEDPSRRQSADATQIDARTPAASGFAPRRRAFAVVGALAAAAALLVAARYAGQGGATVASASALHDEVTAPSPPLTSPSPSFAGAAGPVTTPTLSASTAQATAPARRPPISAVAKPPNPGPKRSNCSPPYTLDPEGVRVAKPECL